MIERQVETRVTMVMTFAQAMLFIMYYATFQTVLVALAAIVGLVFHGPGDLEARWKGWLLLLGLLVCCGPVFVALIYWFRAARDRPLACAVRFGLSMSAITMLYVSAVAVSARRLGLSFISTAELPSYAATAILAVFPISALTAYLMSTRRIPSSKLV